MENISILDILKTVPLVIQENNIDAIKVSDYCLPYSVGIEFECIQNEHFNIEEFKSIPNILDVNVDTGEQRFRIPAGLNGIKTLYKISEALKQNSLLNPLSGIHYHVDCTDIYDKFNNHIVWGATAMMLNEIKDVLKELV